MTKPMVMFTLVSYIPETTAQDVPVLIRNLLLGKHESGSYYMPIQECDRRREPALPSDTWRPSSRFGVGVAQHT